MRHEGADDIIEENPRQNKVMDQPRRLILASTSRYRKELLERLGLAFVAAPPGVDEVPVPGEAPAVTALRLSIEKARALKTQFKDCLIVGSDQVASCEGARLGKPGDHATAVRQLRSLSGKTAQFDTAVSLLDARNGALQSRVVPCKVVFRELDDRRIEAYLRKEQPYDCAGSAKAETLGIALLEAIESDDPTALIGLPLIRTCALLRQAGINPLTPVAAPASGGRR
jgi:septum formation protein